MVSNQVIIYTNIHDPHVDHIIGMAEEMGYEFIRLNTDDIPGNVEVTIGFDKTTGRLDGHIAILTNGKHIQFSSIQSVWWRRPGAFVFPLDLTPREKVFARQEISHAFYSVWSALDCYWVSHPENLRQARWKGEQLQRASSFGFDTPKTLVTSSPIEARQFFRECDSRVIYKVMSDPNLGVFDLEDENPDLETESIRTMTTLITEAETDLFDAVYLVPCQLQEYIVKKVEYRVTVIGEEIFVAEIHSQERQETRLDWRNFDNELEVYKAVLPTDIEKRCLDFVKSYGLNYSALDLILTPDGRYVFIENNPNGQFLFVEQLVPELQMARALTDCLIQGGNIRKY